MGKVLSYIITIIVIAAAAFLIWYFIFRKPPSQQPQQSMQQAPAINVAMPEVNDVEDYYEFTGNVAELNKVDIRARVEGFLRLSISTMETM